jgi:hypothetical protein
VPDQTPAERLSYDDLREILRPGLPLAILGKALDAACAFALAHGVESPISPRDFGIQRSDVGLTTATFLDASHAVTVTVDRYGSRRIAVAELYWIHDEADEERGLCDRCEILDPSGFARPVQDVYLPGDAPAEVGTDA